jgi:hypothetical protein
VLKSLSKAGTAMKDDTSGKRDRLPLLPHTGISFYEDPRIKRPYDISLIKEILIKYIEEQKSENPSFPLVLEKYQESQEMPANILYKIAHVDRRVYSKLFAYKDYHLHISKQSVILLGLALRLNIKQMNKFLAAAGYTLRKDDNADLTIQFCIEHNIYNISDVNTMLKLLDQKPLYKDKDGAKLEEA